MVRMILILLVVTVFAVAVSSQLAYASCGMCKTKAAEKYGDGEIINQSCPVMGGKVDNDTLYKAEYKGKQIGFCCSACVEKFKENPNKYMKKIEKTHKH